jgi:hypothetical protein
MKSIIALIFCMLMVTAHAEKPQLIGGSVERHAICTQNGKNLLCVVVRKDDKLYVVALDEKGEYVIYLVKDKETVLLWARDSI